MGRLSDLHDRVHSGRYRAKPSKRIYIEKDDGRQRPIGIAALEDKIVQKAVQTILEVVYEADFMGFSYGFRPGRSQHNALDALWSGILYRKVNWVLDADIQGFFDSLDHECLMRLLEIRIADRRILRLVRQWLTAGVSEDGQWSETKVGTPQGAVISPLLANVFLHYVLDQWVQDWRKTQAHGDVIIVRYADDFVMGFQYPHDAEIFLKALHERLGEYKLKLHPDKTRLIEFGRYAQRDRTQRDEGKPETFDFLGFTHWCSSTRKNGKFTVGRKPVAKRMRKTLKAIKEVLMKRRHEPVPEQGRWVRSVVKGYFAYFAVPGTAVILSAFRKHICRLWLRALRRRSQRKGKRLTWKRFERIMETWIPKVQILHPYPNQRLIVNPR
jgi:group II intron reverse transcriptase/maturase